MEMEKVAIGHQMLKNKKEKEKTKQTKKAEALAGTEATREGWLPPCSFPTGGGPCHSIEVSPKAFLEVVFLLA